MKKPEDTKTLKYNKICFCETPTCAKCLSVGCETANCLIHTQEAKRAWRNRWLIENKGSSYKIMPNEFGYHEHI